ncbi:MAG: tRNA (adenosine(37)-N6)-threonylcarbamoyltransferase complex ATPase subunit type 1 TsaE [Patescibacteria group bacterium]|nr:tRNA (adenosine(37)-N6)-threonylcarbamoyltransferase complex ATPase subunit type 1 TsaE [Patescibacteria group bacterium]
MKKYLSKNVNQTLVLSLRLAKLLKGGDVVLFKGGLGSGKTTFVKGIARYFGIRSLIQSPTFVIYKPYTISKHRSKCKAEYLYHIDTYRLNNKKGAESLGLFDILTNKNNIVLIENPKYFFTNVSNKKYVTIKNINSTTRLFQF